MPRDRRLALYVLPGERLAPLSASDLPGTPVGASIVRCLFDPELGVTRILLHDPSFDPVPIGVQPPVLSPEADAPPAEDVARRVLQEFLGTVRRARAEDGANVLEVSASCSGRCDVAEIVARGARAAGVPVTVHGARVVAVVDPRPARGPGVGVA